MVESNLSTIKRGSFLSGGVFVLILVFLFHWLVDYNDPSFRLVFNGFEKPIEEIVLNFDDTKLTFTPPILEKGNTLEFFVSQSRGTFSLLIKTSNGQVYELKNIEYKSGNYNYISKLDGSIIYVKGHW
ncbi:hypothetical protein ISG33_14530 [Glaciecola sp. MH2013]|uniref:hypothetical protein n=1 Tax=Glaciecola sp. MH2013 TaxID=2785524 RepID=UPI00189FFBDE|nr:hypothetical protein [Glaciecola sp. MH2013]MBF7074619.1 hypothetical protein [Glaciecola sp. MH2013]